MDLGFHPTVAGLLSGKDIPMPDSVKPLQAPAKPDLSDAQVQARSWSPDGERSAFGFINEGRRWVAFDAEAACKIGRLLDGFGVPVEDPNHTNALGNGTWMGFAVDQLTRLFGDLVESFGPAIALSDSNKTHWTSAGSDIGEAKVLNYWRSPDGERSAFSFISEGRRWVAFDAEAACKIRQCLEEQVLDCSDPNDLTRLHIEVLIGPSVEELRLLYNELMYVFGPLIVLAVENDEELRDDE
jgi:hypothetical protein